MPLCPLARRATSPTRGRHLLASEKIDKGNLIFCERPLVTLQSIGNVHTGALVCNYCMAFCGSPGQALRIAADPTELQGIVTKSDDNSDGDNSDDNPSSSDQSHSDHALIPCRHKCGKVYCSLECQEDDWEWGGHKELCTGRIDDPEHPLVQFSHFAIQSNEIFLLIASWLARIHNQQIPYNEDDSTTGPDPHPMIDFSMNLWWDVATLSMADDPTRDTEMAALEESCRSLCQESHEFLKASWPGYKDSKWLTPKAIARLIGSLEQNCIGVRRKHPLRQNIMEDKALRQDYHRQIVTCLKKSGMIGDSDDEEEEEEEKEGDDDDSQCSTCNEEGSQRNEDVSLEGSESAESETMDIYPASAIDDVDESDYAPDEVAAFLSDLSHPLNIGSDDDWDEIFTPFDGTAHFAFTEKMNHSCEPNTVILYKSRGWGRNHPLVGYCLALKDIEPDEELTISYIEKDEPYESRRKALMNYGFECLCAKCLRENPALCRTADESGIVADVKPQDNQNLEDDNLFGSDDSDDDDDAGDEDDEEDVDGTEDEGFDQPREEEQGGESNENADGDTKLRSAAEKIESIWNKSTHATIPSRYLGSAISFVIQTVSVLNKVPGALDEENGMITLGLLQQCRVGLCERDFSLCRIVGPGLENHLYRALQLRGGFQSLEFREAYWCACCTASIGLAQEGSFLLALQNLDKAIVLGLPRAMMDDFLSYVELFASQMSATPCPHAIECIIPDFRNDVTVDTIEQSEGLSAPITFPISEIACSTPTQVGNIMKESSREEPLIFRGLANSWPALSKWRRKDSFSHSYGHRLVPIEIGSMKSCGGMKEQLMTIRSFISTYMVESTNSKTWWSLKDAITLDSKVAYLAQHPLLEQIPDLWEDVVDTPCVGIQPTNVNLWIGTGGTRTPLHFDSYDNFLVQLVGCKYVRIYHPRESPNLYVIKTRKDNRYDLQGNMSAVDCEMEDYDKHPLAKDVPFTEVLLLPGDCLYIPSRHWHYVRSLTTSASINYWF